MNTEPQKTSHLAMTADNGKDDDNIDLLALLLVLLRGWKTILLFALLALIIGVLYSRYVNPTFKSDALIQIDENSSGISELGENISDLIGSDVNKVQTEAELIKSRMVLEPVVDLLHLSIILSDSEVNIITKIQNNRANTQVNIPQGVSLVTADGKVQVSQFNVPQAYFNQPFTLVRSNSNNDYVLSNGFDDFKGQLGKAHRFKSIEGVIEVTINDLPVNGHTINISKQSLQTTTDSINSALSVVEIGEQTGVIQLSLTGANQQQVSLTLKEIILSYISQNQSRGSEETTETIKFMETQIPELKQKLESAEELFNDFRKKYGTIDVAKEAELLLTENSQIDAQLNELKLKKADLTTYYTEEHPLVIQINDQLKVLNNRKQEIDKKIVGLPEIQREFLKLSQDTEINREIYLTLLKNYQQLQIAKAGQVGYAHIIDMPISTFKEIAPKKLQIWILALLLGLMLGSMLVLIRNVFKKVIKDPEYLESQTGIPVIATIPRSKLLNRLRKNKKSANRLLAYVDSNSLSYEAIKSLRTNLIFNMPSIGKIGKRAKVIVITSESPEVGKSFISANLSEVFAQLDKKILIIDADMRLGKLHRMFNITQDDGLGDYLTQGIVLETVVHTTPIDNIDFIPRGQQAHNPSSLLSGDLFKQMMTKLNEHYDYIVIDTPPVLVASDAMVISQYADKVLMVTRFDKSTASQVSYAIKQMCKTNIQVDGIILNDVQQGIISKYSYHYSYAYGNTK